MDHNIHVTQYSVVMVTAVKTCCYSSDHNHTSRTCCVVLENKQSSLLQVFCFAAGLMCKLCLHIIKLNDAWQLMTMLSSIVSASFNFLISLFINNISIHSALHFLVDQGLSFYSRYPSLYCTFRSRFLLKMCAIHAVFLFEIMSTRHTFYFLISNFVHPRYVFHLSQNLYFRGFQQLCPFLSESIVLIPKVPHSAFFIIF